MQLLDIFRTVGRAQIVHIGSNLYRRLRVELPFDDPAAEQSYSRGRAYVASKLANLVFGAELDRRLRAAGRPIRSLTAHPGMASTPMNARVGGRAQRTVLAVIKAMLARPAERAAIPLLYAAAAEDARPGVFLGPSIRKWDDRVYFDALVAPADDPALAARLWDLAQVRTGVEYLEDVLL